MEHEGGGVLLRPITRRRFLLFAGIGAITTMYSLVDARVRELATGSAEAMASISAFGMFSQVEAKTNASATP